MVNPVLPSNTVAAGQSGHVADHNKITDAIQTVADAVTALEGNGSITTARLADSAVTSAKIADGTIATGDLADGAVTSAKIADGTIATGDIADSAVTSAKIADGTIVNADVNASAAIDVSKLAGVVPSASVGNLLTTAQASVESSLTGWASGSLTLTYDSTTAIYGSGSCLATATSVNSGLNVSNLAAGSRLPVTAGRTYTLISHMRQAGGNAARTIIARFDWYSAATGGTFLGSVVSSATTSTSWLRQVATGVAPVGATHVTILPLYFANSGSIGDSANFDAVSFHEGAGGEWAMPGTVITGLGSYWDETVGRRRFDWDTVNNRWQMTYSDTGWREILTFDNTGTITQGAFHSSNVWGPRSGQAGWVRVRRRNGELLFWLHNIATTGTTNEVTSPVCDLPAGFRWSVNETATPVAATNSAGALPLKILQPNGWYAAGLLSLTTTGVAGDYVSLQQSRVSTDAAWPTTLPGTAVGTIPT